MSKPKKIEKEQPGRVEITAARTPKKKTARADPFARLHLHPLEELEARDNSTAEDSLSSLFDNQYDQVEPSRIKIDQVEPRPTKQNQVELSRAKTDQVEPSRAKPKNIETSPSKNFTKVPNSIARLAIPEKYFRGLSKHTYDILYQRTRGAINPARTIELTKNDLVKLTGLAIHTVKLHIKYLNESGLLVTHRQIGKHSGYIYEVFIPEEIEYDQVEPSRTKQSQNLVCVTDQVLALLGHTQPQSNTGSDDTPKTSFKDKRENDDELTRKIGAKLREAHGRELGEKEKTELSELWDLIAAELGTALAKTENVSNAAKFAVEHFRRKFAKPDYAGKLTSFKKDKVGENSFDRKAELQIWMDLLNEGGNVTDFEQYKDKYATEDWDWLIGEINLQK